MGWLFLSGRRIDGIPDDLFYDCRVPVLTYRDPAFRGRAFPFLTPEQEKVLAPGALIRMGCRSSTLVPGAPHFHRVDYLPAAG